MLEDPDIVKLIEENNLTNEDIIKNDSMLVSYIISKEKCVGCKGVENCQQLNKGYSQSLFYEDDTFKLERKPCTYQQVILEEKAKAERLQVIGIDLSLYNDELFTNTNRKSVLAKVKQVIVNYQKGLANKGFYLHGSYGSGKTYILANLAKILVSSNARVIFSYYPDLVRKIKGYIGKTEFEEIIDELKNIEVLILDDFGGESPNSYIRDEVLLPILQERMAYNRLTFMSSNLNTEQVLEHLAEGRTGVDMTRASRVWERMKVLMDWIELQDKNYR
jgi:primosomal protein DnaI